MNLVTALKNLSPFHFTFFFHLCYQPITSFYFANHANHIYNSLPFTSLFFTSLFFTSFCLHFPSLVFMFLTLVLKICSLLWEVPIAPSGRWFHSVMAYSQRSISWCLFFVFGLWFSNNDQPYLSSLMPVTYSLLLSTPSHQYTLCRAHTRVLSSYGAPEIASLSLPNDAQIWQLYFVHGLKFLSDCPVWIPALRPIFENGTY
jgi:hypothetical protein